MLRKSRKIKIFDHQKIDNIFQASTRKKVVTTKYDTTLDELSKLADASEMRRKKNAVVPSHFVKWSEQQNKQPMKTYIHCEFDFYMYRNSGSRVSASFILWAICFSDFERNFRIFERGRILRIFRMRLIFTYHLDPLETIRILQNVPVPPHTCSRQLLCTTPVLASSSQHTSRLFRLFCRQASSSPKYLQALFGCVCLEKATCFSGFAWSFETLFRQHWLELLEFAHSLGSSLKQTIFIIKNLFYIII